jgi:SAM-dependent methyltransferase
MSVSEPPAPQGPESDDDGVALDVEVVEEVRLPPVPPPPPAAVSKSGPPRPGGRSTAPRPVQRTPSVPTGPIAAMPIITLDQSPKEGANSVEVASTGVRRSSLPPPPAAERKSHSDVDEEVTPLRTRAPADSLVQAIPSPRPPLESEPNLERPRAPGESKKGASEKDSEEMEAAAAVENGSGPRSAPVELARPGSMHDALSGADIIPDELVDSERVDGGDDDHEEIEPEPDSTPSPDATRDERVLAEAARKSSPGLIADEQAEPPEDRNSENPPEVDPADLEIHETPTVKGKQPPPVRMPLPLPLPLYARGAELAAAVQAQQVETPVGKRARYWWDELFGDDFLRTMDRLTDAQIKNEVNFIEESLGVQKGGIILDLACGAGRHAVELGIRGYNVVGYDLSLAMLARAADEAQEKNQKLNFLHGDMRDMGFEEMFDGVYCWSTSFGYFDDEKNQLVAQKIHRALRSGGMLLLDVANRDFVTQRQPSLVWFEGEGCVCMDEMRVDFITSRLRVKRMVILEDGRTRELDYSIRLYTLHELGRMLHDVGFKVTEVSGHPATPGVFMGADSPRLIVLAEKA